MKLAANMKTINVSDCALVGCLSFCLCHSFSFPFRLSCSAPAFCEGDSMVSQLGLSNLSSDLCRTHCSFPGSCCKSSHTQSHTTFKSYSVFCERPTFTQVFDISPSCFFSVLSFLFFSLKHWLLILCVKAAGIPLPELKIWVPPSQPHVTEECEADLSPFFFCSFTGFAIGLRLTLGQVKCTVTSV